MFEKIATIIRQTLDDPDMVLTPKTRADEVPMWDSLKNVDIYSAVEGELGIEFNMAEVQSLNDINLGEFVQLVEAKLAQ